MSKKLQALVVAIVSLPVSAEAGLQPISDEQMSEVTGQAFLSVDRQYHPDPDNTTSYTRVNLGMDIEIQTNVDVLELGRYEREGEKAGSSDVLIRDFALGYINNQAYYQRNPKAARQYRPDGSSYNENEIVPFMIDNPFFEFAFDEATNEVVGVRLGFGDAMGVLSGKIETLTGNVNVDIIDRGEGLRDASSSGNFFDQLIVLLTPLLEGGSPLATKAQLVYGDDNDPRVGELDPIRAEYIGIPNGEKFVLENAGSFTRWSVKNLIGWGSSSEIEVPNCSFFSCGSGDIYVYADGCRVLGIDACFDLDIYNSFPIGQVEEVNGERRLTGPADGAFISFQTKDLDWLKDVKKSDLTVEDFIRATSGAFFNIPNGATEVNLNEALNGTDRYRTEYIDRGRGLF
ncbi:MULTISPECIES: DUF6160 family protein [Marinobacter]|jgi:hypothetical protein|uniref:DUF6160 family protein n=2 Tax=Marinobacter TaxID=2742 RepID=A0ABV4WCB8_9GAMM|nr:MULTISPECIES: DUF6160 family protein [Marinobacter]WBU41879.1 hypothetical protein PBN92_02975 [Marinobacter alkaliphilus]PSF14821.1 hypothetical protein C7H10_03570 [Marinobacter shengliensis]QFS85727.1 hypothetical protein FIV08_02615 [Marinobacter sp. THAF197a]QFT49521.1 hypothetical protein FIU96_02610 [Marinobacter sp. THAF39]BEH13308.1 hypothetical protein MAALD49_06760 [Marinobacter shengliensis]